jgi:hypothetical protein
MSKSDSFFIRSAITVNGGSFDQTSIDLGAYVDALGKSVLRIHNVAVQTYPSLGVDWNIPAATQANVSYQLTTQSQAQLVGATNKSVIATGSLHITNTSAAPGWSNIEEAPDILPQVWTNGYLVGVEQIYLASNVDAQLVKATVEIVMECTVETLSQSAAMALALSQQ